MASPLENYNILIADHDQELARVARLMLNGMGFYNITMTTSGLEALKLIKTGKFDFVITDWRLKEIDGISLLDHIRRDPDSPNPSLPVIMLTGRMERADVETARDRGIHEYVVKPFSVQTLYERLERIVDSPRYFVVGPSFVGPDRRRRSLAPKKEARKQAMLPKRKPGVANMRAPAPQIWLPDFSLKHKLGQDVRLESIITPAIRSHAQEVADEDMRNSLQWIEQDMHELQSLGLALQQGNQVDAILREMTEVVLMISARSATFGYIRASEVAYMLYLFMRHQFQPRNPNHYLVIGKHVEVVRLIFTQHIRNEEGGIMEIIEGLRRVTAKYTA